MDTVSRSITLRHVRAFVAVAREGSFTGAAARISISQPGLTNTINQFESLLGVTLFSRTTRRVELTPDGQEFLPVAERLVADFDRAIAALRNSARRRGGSVEVAVLPSLAVNLLPTIVRDFNATTPSIRIRLKDDNGRGIYRQLRHSEADFALANKWDDDPDLEYLPLFRDAVGLVCLRDHPLATAAGPLRWADLADSPFVGMAPDTGIHPLLHQRNDLPANVLTPEYEVLTLVALTSIIGAKLAITALPALAVPHYSDFSIVYRKLAEPVVEREIFIIRRREQVLSEAAQTVLQMFRTRLRQPWRLLRDDSALPADAFSAFG